MTRLVLDLYLALAGITLLFIGGALAWPIARRIGERRPEPWLWEPVDTHDSLGRRWRPVVPKPTWRARLRARRASTGHHAAPPRPTLRARLHAWWASTAPRDPDAPVRAAMAGSTVFAPSWRNTITEVSDYIGRPPWGAV